VGEIFRLAGRGVFLVGSVYIIGHAALVSYQAHDYLMAAGKVIFFPITFLVYPWFADLWWLQLLSLGAYWASTLFGRP